MVDWWVGFSIAISAFWLIILFLSCLRYMKRRQQMQARVTHVNTAGPIIVGGYKPPDQHVQPPYPGPAPPPPSYAASTMYPPPPPYSANAAYPPPSAPISSVSGMQNSYYNTGYSTDYGLPGVQTTNPGGIPQPWHQSGFHPSNHQPPTGGYVSGQMPGYT